MILEKMTAVGTDGSRVTLWLSDGSRMKVPTSVVVNRNLFQGMELEEDDLGSLMEDAQRASAKARAVRIVSATNISEKNLRRRLIQKGERPEDAQEAVDYLRDMGAVDDESMARSIVDKCVEKGYGAERIRQELYTKGIPQKYWDAALADLPDMSEKLDLILQRVLRGGDPEPRDINRAVGTLQRRGHNWDDISAALTRYRESLERE
jgi:regulatory protein